MWPFSPGPKLDRTQEIRLEELERQYKRLAVEWEEWYDKYRRLYARLSKRVKQSQSADVEENGDEQLASSSQDAPGLTTGGRRGVGVPPLYELAQKRFRRY